jgi:hypothetical protein
MRRVLVLLSRILGRMHLWMPSALILEQAGPLARLDDASRVLLSYYLLMSAELPQAARLFRRLLRRNLGKTAAVNFALATMAQRLGRLRLSGLIYRRASNMPGHSLHHAAAQCLASLVDGALSGSLSANLAAEVDRLNLTPGNAETVIIVPVGKNFIHMFGLWKEQVTRHSSGQIVAMALDPTARQILERDFSCRTLDFSAFFVFEPDGRISISTRGAIWILRVFVLKELVARGHTVLSLDVDAIPVANLDNMLRTFPPADIVAQQDYSIPMDVTRKLGFVVCCGCMLVRPTHSTIAFLESYCKRTMQELDDQLALNHLILRSGVTNIVKTPSYLAFESVGLVFVCPDPSLVSRDTRHGAVIRHFNRRGQSIAELRLELGLID